MLRRYKRDVETLAEFFEAGEKVLDIGAGTGMLAKELQKRTGASFNLIDVVDYNQVDLPFQKYDGAHIPFPDNYFNASMITFVLHHVETYEAQEDLLKEIRRVTRKQLMVLEIAPRNKIERFLQAVWDVIANAPIGVRSTFKYRSDSEWKKLFQKAGWSTHKDIIRGRLFLTKFYILSKTR